MRKNYVSHEKSLDQRLSGYKKLSKGMAQSSQSNDLTGKLCQVLDGTSLSMIAPVVLGGAFTLMGTGVMAQGGCGAANGVSWQPTGGADGEGAVNLDGGGTDFWFSIFAGGGPLELFLNHNPVNNMAFASNGPGGNYKRVKKFPTAGGTVLPGTQNFTNSSYPYVVDVGGSNADWNEGDDGYIGLKKGSQHGFVRFQVANPLVNASSAGSVNINLTGIDQSGGNVTIGNCASLLPAEIVSFFLRQEGKSVILTWKTASEVNNAGFEILRSTDLGKTYHRIGWVDGQGDSFEIQNYAFVDREIETGKNYYYRLKQIDFDGEFTLTPILNALIEGEVSSMSDFYPNPSFGKVKIDIVSTSITSWIATMYDNVGKEVWKDSLELNEGNNELSFNFSILGSGMYFVKFENGVDRFYKKVILK